MRAYAYDVANFTTFIDERGLGLHEVVASDLFDYLDWQQQAQRRAGAKVVALTRGGAGAGDDEPAGQRGPRPVRASGDGDTLAENPVPAARRANG